MKYKFQINGVLETKEDMTIDNVTHFLSKLLEGDKIRLTGITAFELIARQKVNSGRKRREYIRLADRGHE